MLKNGRTNSRHFSKLKAFDLYYEVWKIWGKNNLGLLIFANILMAVVAASTAAYPLVIDFAYDVLSMKDEDGLVLIPLFILSITLIKGVSYYYQTTIIAKIANRIIKDIQVSLYNKIISLDLLVLSNERPGSLQSRLINDLNIFKEAIIRSLNNLVRDALTLIGLLISMIYLDWVLTLIVLIVYPICFYPVIQIGKFSRSFANSLQEIIGSTSSFLNESFSAFRLIKTFNLENLLSRKAQNNFNKLFNLNLKMIKVRAKLEPILEVIGGIAIAAVIVVAGIRIINNSSDIGAFSGFVSALLIAVQPARALGTLNAVMQEGAASAQRILSFYKIVPKIKEKRTAKSLMIKKGFIRFEKVNFGYNRNDRAELVLKNINLSIKSGNKMAIVGPSGSGKSTLVNLIPRLFDPSSGHIKIDGIDIKNIKLKDLRRNIAVVSQDVMLFNATIRENISYGNLSSSLSEIKEAAKVADAHDFICKLPEGYDTNVGERGLDLSGGERQRVSIARAMLKNPKILILDEPTSSLDSESEKNINKSLDKLSYKRTTLIIAHKLSTILNSHKIIFLDNGSIIAQGKHEELMKNLDIYKKMISSQNF